MDKYVRWLLLPFYLRFGLFFYWMNHICITYQCHISHLFCFFHTFFCKSGFREQEKVINQSSIILTYILVNYTLLKFSRLISQWYSWFSVIKKKTAYTRNDPVYKRSHYFCRKQRVITSIPCIQSARMLPPIFSVSNFAMERPSPVEPLAFSTV